MSFCQLCGKQIPDGQKICPECRSGWEPQPGQRPAGNSGPRKAPKQAADAGSVPVILLAIVLVLAAAGFVLALLLGSSGPNRAQSPSGSLERWQGVSQTAGDSGAESLTITAPYANSLAPAPEPEPLPEGEESEYVLPNSDSTYISEAVIAALTPEELRLARNEIYARHGRIFTDEMLAAYFGSKSWYQPLYDAATFDAWGDSILNQYEIANRDLIRQYENMYTAGGN